MKLFSPMSDLNPNQRWFSNRVAGFTALIGLATALTLTPLAGQAQRMTGYGDGPGRSVPQRPVTPAPAPQAPAPAPHVPYGVFSASGPLPEGRVNVSIDGSFEHGQIAGYEVYVQDNGRYGNDQIVVLGPQGKEEMWVNCNVTEEWKSFGPNSEQLIHQVATEWCGWN